MSVNTEGTGRSKSPLVFLKSGLSGEFPGMREHSVSIQGG